MNVSFKSVYEHLFIFLSSMFMSMIDTVLEYVVSKDVNSREFNFSIRE